MAEEIVVGQPLRLTKIILSFLAMLLFVALGSLGWLNRNDPEGWQLAYFFVIVGALGVLRALWVVSRYVGSRPLLETNEQGIVCRDRSYACINWDDISSIFIRSTPLYTGTIHYFGQAYSRKSLVIVVNDSSNVLTRNRFIAWWRCVEPGSKEIEIHTYTDVATPVEELESRLKRRLELAQSANQESRA